MCFYRLIHDSNHILEVRVGGGTQKDTEIGTTTSHTYIVTNAYVESTFVEGQLYV